MAKSGKSHSPDSNIHNVVKVSLSILESFSSFQVRPSQPLVTTSKNNLAAGLFQHQGKYVIYISNQVKAFNNW